MNNRYSFASIFKISRDRRYWLSLKDLVVLMLDLATVTDAWLGVDRFSLRRSLRQPEQL